MSYCIHLCVFIIGVVNVFQVNDVSAAPETVVSAYPEKFGGSRNHLDDESDYKPPYSNSPA